MQDASDQQNIGASLPISIREERKILTDTLTVTES